MSKTYNNYCMKFSNEELKRNLYDKFCKSKNLQIKCLSEDGDEIEIDSNIKIETIAFDAKENVSIMFFGYQTSIFAHDVEVMFIDENFRDSYTSSDVYNNVVYEGNLREMSHEQMLNMFWEMVMCFIDATDVSMTRLDAPVGKYKEHNYYEPHMFIVNVRNNHITEKVSIYENITIKY